MQEEARIVASWVGQPSDLSLYNKESIGHLTADSHDPGFESREDFARELMLQLRDWLVDNQVMESMEQSATVRIYFDLEAISVQPHTQGRGYEYIAIPEPATPFRRKKLTTYTVSRLCFNEEAVTERISKMRREYDVLSSFSSIDTGMKIPLLKQEYESLLSDVRWQNPEFVDPWPPKD